MVEPDEAFHAWTSRDVKRMLAAVGARTNPIDRHFLLLGIVRESYRLRANREIRETCLTFARRHVAEFPALMPSVVRNLGGIVPRVPTYAWLATLLTEDGECDEAIEVCRAAQRLGLEDGTKTGFAGRVARIESKQARKAAR
jgi:hypothetical protein